ncbi:MAG: stage II sporulation protein M [Clostridiales bacterium]|uniref:stage II sporulation protein M n=1 Tax=Clostridium sp. N3C TaxID=1776758 RepID=UPI00092E1F0F|nr:stage II sporulation protein M [Clostridium sp. N3C]NLZ47689.1 stage II sporulation protein M [Clostridiales bacterium]SCN21394.1 Stage II sporulation protein M [Clostridium sp. N3C]
MRKIKANTNVTRHFQESMWLYVITLICLFTGIVLGIYTVRYMGDMERQDLINYFLSFKNNLNSIKVDSKAVLLQTIKSNLPIIIGLWILGLTIIGIPAILIIDIIKGFSLGFSLTTIFYGLSYKGIWFTMLGILPQNIIYVPCIIVSSVLAMKLSLFKLKDRVNKQMNYNKSYFFDYSITFLIITLIMILGFIYEAYITPKALQSIAMLSGSVYA